MKVKEIIADNSVWMPNEHYDEVKPLVSIILPTYSRAKSGLLKKCLNSIVRQSFRRWELIIVVDASTDGTTEICESYRQKDPRINIILHKENIGLPAVSTYEAYLKCRGEYIAYAFDDNQWELTALAKTFDFMEENNVKASYGITTVPDPVSGAEVRFGDNPNYVEKTLWAGNCIGAGSVVLHREVLETVGLHDPHLSLTRVCDWDLWLRVIDHFRFEATGISFTKEMGTMQSDSLGNLFKLDQWFFRERQQHRDPEQLLLDNYGEVDVTEYSEWNSPHYFECLQMHLKQYEKKSWYKPQIISQIQAVIPNENHKYGLILCSGITASIMNFTRYDGNDFTFCYSPFGNILHSICVLSDFAVICRIPDIGAGKELLKEINIPCYYFIDDNFKEITIDDQSDPVAVQAAKNTTRKFLKNYEGVIVTTEPLRSYFLEKGLHQNVLMLSALWREPIHDKQKKYPLTIGFMGGSFRLNVLQNCVLPVLYQLSKNKPIRLICPCSKETEEKIKKLGKENLEIIPFYRTFQYEFLLNEYYRLGVDVLIHCGSNLRNNYYKTKNALINAVTLNVPLLSSDIEPYYDQSDGSEGAYLIVRNTKESWNEALDRMINDADERTAVLQKAEKFCKEHFNSETVWQELTAELTKIEHPGSFYLMKRYEKIFDWTITHGGIQTITTAARNVRPFNQDDLCYSGELNGCRRYGFTSPIQEINSIGLLFAVIGECSGTVTLSIFKKWQKDPITKVTLPMEELNPHDYTNILLPELVTIKPKEELFMDVNVQYTQKNGSIGIFEDKHNRTFIYKVFNKLGHPLPGKNALFIDCRA